MAEWDPVPAAPQGGRTPAQKKQPQEAISAWEPVQQAPAQSQAPVSPQAADAFKRFGVSPQEYDFDPATNTVKRKPDTGIGLTRVEKGLEPITSYIPTERQMARESLEQVGRGARQLAGSGDAPLNKALRLFMDEHPEEDSAPGFKERVKGAANVGLGGISYVSAPINAALRTFLGKPVEENIGIPKEYTEFAAGLALPIVGFGKTPKTIEKIFSPETVAPEAMEAAGLIRQHTGQAARRTATTESALTPYEAPMNALSPADQLGVQKYMEGTGPAPASPQIRASADELRGAFKERRDILENMPSTQGMTFYDEYFPHFWKDPNKAKDFVRSWTGGGKQGSGASTKGRTLPTIEDGLAAGLEPVYTNPIQAGLHYITSMDKFIAAERIFQAGEDSGIIIYRRPKSVGASGHPEGVQGIPPGYAPLSGRGAQGAMGEQAFAPEAWARVYNNFLSRGVEQFGEEFGTAYNALRKFNNFMTQTLLGFSGYHAFTMAEATMSNQMAKAVSEARGLKPGGMAKEIGKWAVAPVTYAARGKNFREMYLGKVPMSPQDKEIIDLITDAGGRMSGAKHALDYDASALGDYITAFKRGRLRMELGEQAKEVSARPFVGTAKVFASNMARVMDTFNKPIFQHYIPAIKNAAAYENLAQFLKQNPNATQAEKLAAARKVVDSIDNRFGEMIQDNIFWHKAMKQTAMLSMLSYSWNMGGWRELGGGFRDIGRSAFKGNELTPKADYLIGMTINWGIMSSVYQYLKTGEGPKDLHDLAAPRTGGVDERTGEDERIIPPGIMKDIFGYTHNFGQEVTNKLNPGLKILGQTASIATGMGGKDWRDDPIVRPGSEGEKMIMNAPDWLADYFAFLTKTMTPIQLQDLGKGPEQGSALNSVELALGIRKAPRYMIDPNYDRMLNSIWRRKWQGKERHDRQEQQRYGGTD